MFSLQQENVPAGWFVRYGDSPDELLYCNEQNDEVWGKLSDEDGKAYYYKVDGSETVWELPAVRCMLLILIVIFCLYIVIAVVLL